MSTENMENVNAEDAIPEVEQQEGELNEEGEQQGESEGGNEEINKKTAKEAPKEEEKEELDPFDAEIEALMKPEKEGEEKTEKIPKWVEHRLAKKEREIEAERARAMQLEAMIQQREKQAYQPQSQMPVPQKEDYVNEADYMEAMVDYNLQRRSNAYHAELQRNAATEQRRQFVNKWMACEEEGLREHEDFSTHFARLNSPNFPPNPAMAQAILESPHKLAILNFLGQNIEFAEKVAKKSMTEAIKDIAKIELKIAQSKKAKTTKAPPIIEPVRGNKGAPPKAKPEDMEMDEFRQWYAETQKRAY